MAILRGFGKSSQSLWWMNENWLPSERSTRILGGGIRVRVTGTSIQAFKRWQNQPSSIYSRFVSRTLSIHSDLPSPLKGEAELQLINWLAGEIPTPCVIHAPGKSNLINYPVLSRTRERWTPWLLYLPPASWMWSSEEVERDFPGLRVRNSSQRLGMEGEVAYLMWKVREPEFSNLCFDIYEVKL